jgi:sulfonate transport system substrate-binding protein
VIARDGSGINRLEDLAGKSVAANRSGLGELVLVAALEKRKIDRASVRIVYLNPADGGTALAAGKVDAWSMWSPAVDIAREQYQAHTLFVETELDFRIDFTGMVATRQFAAANPDLLRKVNAAYAAEARWISENPLEAQKILQKMAGYSDGIRDRFVAMHVDLQLFDLYDRTFLARLQRSADWLTAHRVLPEQITVSDHLAAS